MGVFNYSPSYVAEIYLNTIESPTVFILIHVVAHYTDAGSSLIFFFKR